MNLLLIADTFPPDRTSGAVQLRDLCLEFVQEGHSVTVITPGFDQSEAYVSEVIEEVEVIRIRAWSTKNVSSMRRGIAETALPFFLIARFTRSPFNAFDFDGVIWYSPTIFLWPVALYFKTRSRCKGYLILRDIFPNWALDLGILRRGPAFYFFSLVAHMQYRVADFIGVQSSSSLALVRRLSPNRGENVQVLNNWLGAAGNMPSTITVSDTKLVGRKVFIYTGNMGVAQGIDVLIDLALRFKDNSEVGFLFVGRGSEVARLKRLVASAGAQNVLFFDEVPPQELPRLYSQCSVGLVSLDSRHLTHNVPGKFLSYIQSGLPVLASVNKGNDLCSLINESMIGVGCDVDNYDILFEAALKVLAMVELEGEALRRRCVECFEMHFSVGHASRQIINSLRDWQDEDF